MKKRMKGFQNKLFGIMVLIVSLTVLVLTVFFSRYVRSLSIEMMVERYENKTKLLSDIFLNYYDEIDSDMDNFIVNEYVQKSLGNGAVDGWDREMVTKALALLGGQTDYYLYIDNKGNMYSQKSIAGEEGLAEALGERLGDDYSKTKLVWMEDRCFGDGELQLFACRYIRAMNQSREPGILLLRLRSGYLEEKLKEAELGAAGGYLLDDENRICLSFGAEEQEDRRQQVTEAAGAMAEAGSASRITGKDGLIRVFCDTRSDFKVVVHVPRRTLMSHYYHVLMIAVLVFLLITGIVFFVSYRTARWVARPIQEINSFMLEFHNGSMEERLNLHTGTELDSIGNSCNQMLEQIQGLVEEVKYRESELRKSEMNSLMYQINPHFLYNTLDAVYMLARLNQEREIMQMIQSLTKLLRINLSNGADIITLRDELTYVKAYMDILKIRNDNLFTYEILCEEELRQRMIMKLLLQPLAENCVKHGFAKITEGGVIMILVREEQGRLLLQVKNNGELIPEDRMEQINCLAHAPMEEVEAFLPQGKGGYGISNVIKRLRLHYGEAVDFYFEIEGEYTVCSVGIPVEALKK